MEALIIVKDFLLAICCMCDELISKTSYVELVWYCIILAFDGKTFVSKVLKNASQP